jgi:hypothetical protein
MSRPHITGPATVGNGNEVVVPATVLRLGDTVGGRGDGRSLP